MRILSTALLFLCIFGSGISTTTARLLPLPQMGVGGISGKIMGDLTNVKGAEVLLMRKDKLIDQTQTDENGNFQFLYVDPGKYDIKATKAGYRTSIIIKVQVEQDHTTPLDLYLPKYNNTHMLKDPAVETYEENYSRYMRHINR